MSRNNVHFRKEVDVVYYADFDQAPTPLPPSTPSPTFSATTPSPHSSRSAPRPVSPSLRAFESKQLGSSPKGIFQGACLLHPLLSPDTIISFDLNHHPLHGSPNIILKPEGLKDPAILPNAPTMTIVHNSLPWGIVIHPASRSTDITVSDVLGGIYDALHLTTVTEAEFWTDNKVKSVAERWSARVRGQEDKSRRRIDWLPTRERRFAGLAPHTDGHSWSLSLGTN